MSVIQQGVPPGIRISIALCTYNGERYLNQQLSSFLEQEYTPFEVVVCDDGSTDATASILRSFADVAPFPVRIYPNTVNLGYSRNFTQAAGLCRGDVIAFSDQDDLWYPTKLTRMAQLFAAHPDADGIFTDGDLIGERGELLPGTLWSSFAFHSGDIPHMQGPKAVHHLLRRNVVTGMAFAFRATCKSWLTEMPEHWPHDSWLALVLGGAGRLLPCSDRLVGYRVHATQQLSVPITSAAKRNLLRSGGLRQYLSKSRERNMREYAQLAQQYDSLLAAGDTVQKLWWIPFAKRKAEHMHRVVQQLSKRRWKRWPFVMSHISDYRRYAPTGVMALVRDLIL